MLFVDSTMKHNSVLQLACDEGMCDSFLDAGWEPFEDFLQHLQGEEAGCSDGVDLGDHVEMAVDNLKVLGVGSGGGSKFSRPPAGIQWQCVLLEDHNFCLVRVEFETVGLHPVNNFGHAGSELVLCVWRLVREGE